MITEVIKAIDGGCVSEIEFLGPDGNIIGYWAYGYYDPQYPYQGNESIMEDKQPKALRLADELVPDELQLFESWIVREAGPGATKRWLNTDSYENMRVNDYRTGWVACLELISAAPQPVSTAEVPMPEPVEHLAITRYRPVPNGMFGYKVVAGDGTRSVFEGTKSECTLIARKLTEAFLDGAHVAGDAPEAAGYARGKAENAKDAERYRWLRDGNDRKESAAMRIALHCYGMEWDAAIDAALRGEVKP